MTKHTVLETLRQRVLVLDGGMGSALIARGLSGGACSELWDLERPDVVRGVHVAYYEAGSDVVQTNTFGGNALALARHGLGGQVAEINRAAARIAREAAEQAALAPGCSAQERYVAGNIGPSGELLAPVGKAEPARLEDAFAEQAAFLVEGGVDYLSIETMSDLNEALCALRGVQRTTQLPVSVCLTFDKKPRGFFTIMGNRPDECAKAIEEAGAAAVGVNCSVASDAMRELCPIIVQATALPVVLKPNAGAPEIGKVGRPVYRQSPDDFAKDAAAMVASGAAAVGGCCGTDHSFIASLRRALRFECSPAPWHRIP